MNKRFHELKIFYRRGLVVVFLFCLSITSLVLSLWIEAAGSGKLNIISILLTVFGTLTFIISFINSIMNLNYVKKIEEYLLLSNYAKADAEKYIKFNRLVDENLFQYHFQPIVNARTGEVFAYEALMRTNESISMSPNEILYYADKENRLYDIEKLTFTNTLRIMSENLSTFGFKKLFINSISNHLMQDEDFEHLFQEYGPLFDNVVLEITEFSLLDEAGIKSIQKRLHRTGCQLALDDYGSGYSNESILLNTNPNYIKIDQLILRNINSDPKKQHLVSNIVSFASKNHIKTIAEGVESYEEFVYVIKLGVDYIQGYYTGKPNPVLLQTIPDKCLDTVYALNQSTPEKAISARTYETINASVVLSLDKLAQDQYNAVFINDKEIKLQGEPDHILNMKIRIADNLKSQITLENVNIQAGEPTISLGENCIVVLKLAGNNYLYYDGIYVPESSALTIVGDGNLTIQANRRFGTGIGASSEQSYGNITLAGSGSIKIFTCGEIPVGIGGGYSQGNSKLTLASGNIQIDVSGNKAVGIGNIKGKADVICGDCNLQVRTVASMAAAIGCIKGQVNIMSNCSLDISCEGGKTVAIGALTDGEGCITIVGGAISIHSHSHSCAGIGGIGGNIDIGIYSGEIDIYSEGSDVVGIGDSMGTGIIRITNGIISTSLFAAHPLPIGNATKRIMIDGGNIRCTLPEGYTAVNSYGVPLVMRNYPAEGDFRHYIVYGNASYEYCASYSDKYDDIQIYLPEDIEILNES